MWRYVESFEDVKIDGLADGLIVGSDDGWSDDMVDILADGLNGDEEGLNDGTYDSYGEGWIWHVRSTLKSHGYTFYTKQGISKDSNVITTNEIRDRFTLVLGIGSNPLTLFVHQTRVTI